MNGHELMRYSILKIGFVSSVIMLFLVLRPIVGIWAEHKIGFVNIPVIMTIGVISIIPFSVLSDYRGYIIR